MSDIPASDSMKKQKEPDMLLLEDEPKDATVITKLKDERQKRITNVKMRFFGRKMYRIVMQHVNNTESVFYVKVKHGQYFRWKKYLYFIDQNAARYSNTAKCWQLEYHERCTIPIIKHISFTDLVDDTETLLLAELKDAGLVGTDVKKYMLRATFDPRTSLSIIEADFVQKVANKGEMQRTLAVIMAVMFVIGGAIIGLFIFMFQIYNMISGIQGVG